MCCSPGCRSVPLHPACLRRRAAGSPAVALLLAGPAFGFRGLAYLIRHMLNLTCTSSDRESAEKRTSSLLRFQVQFEV